MLTVAEEMSAEERASQLAEGLSASSAEEVVVYFEHLAHAVGMEEAEKLAIMTAAEHSTARSDYSNKTSQVAHCFCVVPRKKALEVVKKALQPKVVSKTPVKPSIDL